MHFLNNYFWSLFPFLLNFTIPFCFVTKVTYEIPQLAEIVMQGMIKISSLVVASFNFIIYCM